MRIAVVAAATCLSLVGLSGAQDVEAAIKRLTNIPAQPLTSALQLLAKAHGFQIVYRSDLVSDIRTPGATGELTTDEALTQLLSGTALAFKYLDDRTITIIRQPSAGPAGASNASTPTSQDSAALDGRATAADSDTPARRNGEAPSLSFWDRFRLAQADETKNAPDGSMERSGNGSDGKPAIEEILVTAQKREERLQDVPVPVTAISAEALVGRHQLRIQDYYTRIPGLSLTLIGDSGTPSAVIRGVTTGTGTTPTVGIVVDDVAFGSSTVPGLGVFVPDFDPSELARIEVLRGPQGTLYGANSMGGLIKFVTADPVLGELSSRLQAGMTSVKNTSDLGYSVRGSANVPLGETFAIRAGGTSRQDPGYVDDPSRALEGVNQADSDSGRLAALWRPTDRFSLKMNALLQRTQRDGESYVFEQPTLSDLQHTALPNTGSYQFRLQAYSATVAAQLARAEITSISGFSRTDYFTAIDATLSALISGRTQTQFGVRGATNPQHWETEKFSQEIRLALPLAERVAWLVGLFYADEEYLQNSDILAVDPISGAVAGSWLHAERPSAFEERALFTNLTFDITDRLDIQIGGRVSDMKFATGAEESFGPWNVVQLGRPSPNFAAPAFESKESPFTYLVTPRFRMSPDLMVYARLASGYRPGGPNTTAAARDRGLPLEYEADTTENYEIGLKGSAFDRALAFDASVYYIDWKDLQIFLRDPASLLPYFTNAGRARSQGVELSVEARPLRGLTIAVSGAWNDAELTEPFPVGSTVTGAAGDRLPYSARWTGNLSIDQELDISSRATLVLGASASYVGDRLGTFFPGVAPRQTFPSYAQVDLRASAKFDSWTIEAYVNNVADERGVLRGGRDAIFSLPYIFYYTQPRTAGISLTKVFD